MNPERLPVSPERAAGYRLAAKDVALGRPEPAQRRILIDRHSRSPAYWACRGRGTVQFATALRWCARFVPAFPVTACRSVCPARPMAAASCPAVMSASRCCAAVSGRSA